MCWRNWTHFWYLSNWLHETWTQSWPRFINWGSRTFSVKHRWKIQKLRKIGLLTWIYHIRSSWISPSWLRTHWEIIGEVTCLRTTELTVLCRTDFYVSRNGNPLQYSCLENCPDRETWRATVDEVAKSQIWLSMHATTSSDWRSY